MIHLRTIFDLRKHPPTDEVIYVTSVKKMYRSIGGEWIELAYYNSDEVAKIFNITRRRLLHIKKKMGISGPVNSKSIDRRQLKLLAKVLSIRREKPYLKYEEIRKMLRP